MRAKKLHTLFALHLRRIRLLLQMVHLRWRAAALTWSADCARAHCLHSDFLHRSKCRHPSTPSQLPSTSVVRQCRQQGLVRYKWRRRRVASCNSWQRARTSSRTGGILMDAFGVSDRCFCVTFCAPLRDSGFDYLHRPPVCLKESGLCLLRTTENAHTMVSAFRSHTLSGICLTLTFVRRSIP